MGDSPSASQWGIGIVGCGNISAMYARGLARFGHLRVVSCCDLDPARAQALADEHDIPKALPLDELLRDDEVDIVVNLTVPAAHADVTRAATEHGKHVYSEKPLAVDVAAARDLLQRAGAARVSLGCGPDTFFGSAVQTARRLLDEGVIGEPVAAAGSMTYRGPELWHPNPGFFYEAGAGPMYDMGPYYVTNMVCLLGPVRRVTASVRATFPQRTITSEPLAGQKIDVVTPTHYAAVLDMEAGPVCTLTTSFDVWGTSQPNLEVYGSEGSMRLPDPNHFDGAVSVRLGKDREWREATVEHGVGAMRGAGVADLAWSLEAQRPPRASGELALHVLETLAACELSSNAGEHILLESSCERPEPLPVGRPELVGVGGEAVGSKA